MVELTGLPIVSDFEDVADLPHTLTSTLTYRARIKSFNELPREKRPPRNLWDKPSRLSDFFDEMFGSKDRQVRTEKYIEYNQEDVE